MQAQGKVDRQRDEELGPFCEAGDGAGCSRRPVKRPRSKVRARRDTARGWGTRGHGPLHSATPLRPTRQAVCCHTAPGHEVTMSSLRVVSA